MSYQPVVLFDGPAGWAFLERTRERQQDVFEQSVTLRRNTDAFQDRIAKIGSAEELVADRQLLQVALGAFGLDDDIDNKFLIEKVLNSDNSARDSLTSKFSDKRYQEFSKAFGFGDEIGPQTGAPGFADRIVAAYKERQFEIAIGNESQDMRLAMSMERELDTINAKTKLSPDGAWFTVMANPPLRAVFETALGLPKSLGTLDLDQQLSAFRDRAERVFGKGEVADFADPDLKDELRTLFLVRSQVQQGLDAMSSGSTALTLLQSAVIRF